MNIVREGLQRRVLFQLGTQRNAPFDTNAHVAQAAFQSLAQPITHYSVCSDVLRSRPLNNFVLSTFLLKLTLGDMRTRNETPTAVTAASHCVPMWHPAHRILSDEYC